MWKSFKLFAFAMFAVLALACNSSGPVGDSGIEILDMEAYCDGSDPFDWLLVVAVETSSGASDVWCEVSQGSLTRTIDLDPEGSPTIWAGAFWEDDLGVDCDNPVQVTCYAE